MKYPKWRIGITLSTHHIVEVYCSDAQTAMAKALTFLKEDGEKWVTGQSHAITSCMINDKEARDFSVYVPEQYPGEQNEKS